MYPKTNSVCTTKLFLVIYKNFDTASKDNNKTIEEIYGNSTFYEKRKNPFLHKV